jgi:hypothetical protein
LGCTAFSLKSRSLRSSESFSETKISEFDGNVLVQKAVFELQVTMGDSLVMYEFDSRTELRKESSGVVVLETSSILHEVECLSIGAELGHNVERVFRASLSILGELTATSSKKANNIWVRKSRLSSHDFGFEGLLSRLVHVFEDLDAAFHVLVCVLSEVANAKLTVTELSDEFVVLNSMST